MRARSDFRLAHAAPSEPQLQYPGAGREEPELARLEKNLEAAADVQQRQAAGEDLTRARLRILNEHLLAQGRLGMR